MFCSGPMHEIAAMQNMFHAACPDFDQWKNFLLHQGHNISYPHLSTELSTANVD